MSDPLTARHLPATQAALHEDGWLAPHFPAIAARSQRAAATALTLTGGKPLWEWAQGHKWYGLHRISPALDADWIYRDWAPNATALWLVGDFSGWQRRGEFQARRINDRGEWVLEIPSAAMQHGQHYQVEMDWPGGSGGNNGR